jgi:hypothetical protein
MVQAFKEEMQQNVSGDFTADISTALRPFENEQK